MPCDLQNPYSILTQVCAAVGGWDVEAQGTAATGAVEMQAALKPTTVQVAGHRKPLLELPPVVATVSLPESGQPAAPSVQLRAGRLSACLAPEPLEGVLRLLQAPTAVPRHPAAAAAAAAGLPTAPSPSTIVAARLEQLRRASERARGPPPTLPALSLFFDGAEVVLLARQHAPAQALHLFLGTAHVRTSASEKGEPRVTGTLESVEMVLMSSLAGKGRVQLLRLSRTGVEAAYATPSNCSPARRPTARQGQRLGPQAEADWLPSLGGQQGKAAALSAPAAWSIIVSLPAIQSTIHLDHLLEALWIVGGGPGAGLVNEVRT